MTNVSIIGGCDLDTAEQFNEGADTYVRVCDPAGARLRIYSEERCLAVVKVNGNQTFSTIIEADKPYEFRCADILKTKPSRAQAARAGFIALLGGHKAVHNQEELASDFLLEIRKVSADAPLDGSYNFRLLSDEAFTSRFAGYMQARVVEEPKPIFTRDARPITCLANETTCSACGTVITDCIAGCENGDCPTVKDTASLKATGHLSAGDKKR